MSEFKRGDTVRLLSGRVGEYIGEREFVPGTHAVVVGDKGTVVIVTSGSFGHHVTDEEIAEQVALERFLTDGGMSGVRSAIRLAFRLRDERDGK